MGPIIAQALSLGYTGLQVLNFISGKVKGIGPQIKNAQAMGYTADQIIKFLGGKIKSKGNEQQLTANDAYLKQQGFKTKGEKEETRNKFIKGAMTLGSGALGAYALNRALPKAPGVLQGQVLPPLPQQPQQPQLGGLGQQLGLPAPGQAAMQPPYPMPGGPQGPLPYSNPTAQGMQQPNSPVSPSPLQPQGQSLQQQPPQVAQQAPNIPTAPSAPPLPEALQNQVDSMLSAGNPIDNIAGALKVTQPKIVKEYEKATGQPIARAIEDFAKSNPVQAGKPEPMAGSAAPETEIQPDGIQRESRGIQAKEPIKLEKKTVALPNGDVGEVTNIRQGIATVNVAGKEYRRKVEELDEEPEDVVETVQNLLKIPEVDKSSVVSLFTFDPEEKKMYIQYHNGDSFKYLDVDPEKVYKIANKMGIPVTEGKNVFGAWSPEDKKSLGAALIKEIVNDPKYKKAKKGEKPNPNYVKLETLYDYWEKLRKKPQRKRV